MTFEEVDQFEIAMENAIDMAMETVVTEGAKDAIADSVYSNVYSYNPIFLSRRNTGGGLPDRNTMQESYDAPSKTLTIKMETEWQNLGFRYIDGRGTGGNDLSDVVENNNIYNAPPRPFMQPAEDDYASNRFEADLMSALNKL